MTTIENEFLKVTVRSQGAEMTSIFNKQTQTEHLWQSDASIWPWHAPNLFPIVGGLFNNELHVNGTTYQLASRHGFTRESQFALVEASAKHAKFSLPFSEATLAVYPYKFEFQVLYDLFDHNLRVTYKVINQDGQTIYFSVGGHPAFQVPFLSNENYEDYYLEFETSEPLLTHLLSNGLLSGETEPVPMDGRKLWLTKNLFDRDALIFKAITSKNVTIRSKNHQRSLSVSFQDFKDLGIWAKPGAPFVCIEPWLGYTDTEGKVTELKDKEGIEKVEHGHVFEAEFIISLLS